MDRQNARNARTGIDRQLRRTWRREQSRWHLRGLGLLVAYALAAFLLLFLIDWALDLPLYLRWALLAAAAGGLAWILVRHWLIHLHWFNPMREALRVEAHYPELNSLVISYVQLQGPRPAATGSAELEEVVREQAAETAQPYNFASVVSFATLKRVAAAAVAAVLIFAAVAFAAPADFAIAGRRLLGADIAYTTDTIFHSFSADAMVKEGSSVPLEAHVGGEVPMRGKIWIRPEGGDWRSVGLQRQDGDVFNHVVPHAARNFEFYFEIGDARSHRRGRYGRITVVPPPVIETASVDVEPPAYTGRKPFQVDTLNLPAPEGSKLTVRVQIDRPVGRATCVLEDGGEVPVQIDGAGRDLTTAFELNQETHYRFRWTPLHTDLTFEGEPYRLTAVPDRAPTVSLLAPTGEVKATVNKTLELRVRADDDHGLENLALVFGLNNGEQERRIDLGPPAKPDSQKALPFARSGTWPVVWVLKQDLPHLAPGDTVQVAVEVADVAPEGEAGRTARSDERSVEILSVPAYQRYILAKLDVLKERVGQAETMEKQIKHEVEALKKMIKESGSMQDGSSDQPQPVE